jgi:hypothetical protein
VANRYAGTGREYNVTSAIHVEGVPPRMESISILHSAFTGINVTAPEAPVIINNCTVQYNKGTTREDENYQSFLSELMQERIEISQMKKIKKSIICPMIYSIK